MKRPSAPCPAHKILLHTLRHAMLWIVAAVLCLATTSCDDNTDSFGHTVIPSTDGAVVSQALFDVYTRSLRVDSLLANTSTCYLGRMTDPETDATTTCSFLAQFYIREGSKLPPLELMHQADGAVAADSCELRLYIRSYYGDSLNAMKIGVYELDAERIMDEGKDYYTTIDPELYLSRKADAIRKELTFSVTDLSLPDSIRYSSDHARSIAVKLPAAYGTKILQAYYDNPESFKNSYYFIRNVVPGFYVKAIAGNGTIANIDVSTLSVYYRYTEDDSTYVSVLRVAATEEVLQNNRFDNANLDALLDSPDFTMVKSPAGIFTEIDMPIDTIYDGHANDSINSARLVFRRINNSVSSRYNQTAPAQLLMIEKTALNAFFSNHQVYDNRTTFLANYNTAYNSYSFNNIATLISAIRHKRDQGAGVTPTDTEAQAKAKRDAWIAANPDWNKVLLVPVSTSVTGLSTVTAVNHDFGLHSVRLFGSQNNPLQLSVVYSRFK